MSKAVLLQAFFLLPVLASSAEMGCRLDQIAGLYQSQYGQISCKPRDDQLHCCYGNIAKCDKQLFLAKSKHNELEGQWEYANGRKGKAQFSIDKDCGLSNGMWGWGTAATAAWSVDRRIEESKLQNDHAPLSSQDCPLLDPTVAFQTLDAIRRLVQINTRGTTDLTQRAVDNGFFENIPGVANCTLRLYGSRKDIILELQHVNYKTCSALQVNSLLKKNNVGIMVWNDQTKQEGNCAINPVTELFPLVGRRLPGLNRVSLHMPSLGKKSELFDCEPLSSTRNLEANKRIEQALVIIEEYGTWSARYLDYFRRYGGKFRVCTDKDTSLNDFEFAIEVGTQQLMGTDEREAWDTPRLVRVLLEEIAHANRSMEDWPNPAEYTKAEFVETNKRRLLDLEAEGWILSWLEAGEINKRTRFEIPLMAMALT